MLLRREFIRIPREFSALKVKYITAAIIGVILILVYHRIGKTNYSGFQNIAGFFMMVDMNLIMTAVTNNIQSFPDQRTILLREQASGQYSISAYYLSYVLASIPFAIVVPTIMIVLGFIVSFLINGLGFTAAKFFIFCNIFI